MYYFEIYSITPKLYSITVEVYCITVELCSITVELCSITVELCSITVELCCITVELYSITVELCSITVELCSITVEVYCITLQITVLLLICKYDNKVLLFNYTELPLNFKVYYVTVELTVLQRRTFAYWKDDACTPLSDVLETGAAVQLCQADVTAVVHAAAVLQESL